MSFSVWFLAPKHATPSVSTADDSDSGFAAGAPTVDNQSVSGFRAYKTANATTNGVFNFTWIADADL